MANIGGWTGKILRVNLTNGDIKIEDTMKYKDYIGGMGIGYKVMWDEVPAGTKAFDEENKIIFGAGPLTGTGAVCSARTNITSLLPTNPFHGVSDSHMGGHFSPEMKYAGWDAIIIEGKSSKPVWLRIEDDKVTIEDASFVWGQGIFKATAEIQGIIGQEAAVACIGQAGENMVNQAVIMNCGTHSAGGHGGVMGSKNLKAIAVKGTQAVHIAGDKKAWMELDEYIMTEIIGANNQHVVPMTPQPWAEFHHSGSRWSAREGLFWGAANPPVETGVCEPNSKNNVGLRTQKAIKDHGAVAEKYTVRMGGCQSCPIRCHSQLKLPQLEKYNVSPYVSNTCAGYSSPGRVMMGFNENEGEVGEAAMIAKGFGAQLADDYGVWCNYSSIGREFNYLYKKGIFKKVLPEEEYNSIHWHLLEANDPQFLRDFYRRVSLKIGEFSHIGDGTHWIAERWNLGEEFWNDKSLGNWSKMGHPKHHASEANGQVGALINSMFNRDAQCHSHTNFLGSGLPIGLQKEIAAEIWGSGDAVDAPLNYTPVNEYKIKFVKWSIVKNILHDSLTLCNWMYPMATSPYKDKGYRGDTTIEAKLFSLATGVETSEEELDLMGERIFTLHRALTVKQMGTIDMRNKHDDFRDWIFDTDPDKKAFTPGTIKMDRDDIQLGLTMLYKEMGWDEKTGAPTKETLLRLGMPEVAAELEQMGLLP